jgi:hypothetical protein
MAMFRRSKTESLKANALSASELALQLAQDKRFRKRLLAAMRHSSEAGRRTRRGLGLTGAVTRFATDEALHAELRSARNDLQRAYARVETKRRTHKLRRLGFLAGLASLAAVPRLRERVASALAKAPTDSQRLRDLTGRLRSSNSGGSDSRPSNLEDLTKEELYVRAQEAEIPGRSEMSKDQLIEALRARSA